MLFHLQGFARLGGYEIGFVASHARFTLHDPDLGRIEAVL